MSYLGLAALMAAELNYLDTGMVRVSEHYPDVEHYETPKPLTKRQKRRLRKVDHDKR